jgi:Flp pilus assembly protein TadB
MDPAVDARREAALELQTLAEDFERSDRAALRRTRIVCWGATAVVTIVVLLLLIAAADWRYLAALWVAVVGLTWAGYSLSSRRQRQQTERLRDLASRWLSGEPKR